MAKYSLEQPFNKIALILSLAVTVVYCENYILQTRLGQIKGEVVTRNGNKIYEFRKIPFAKPPVGELRFTKPVPFGTWKQTLDGTTHPASCVQPALGKKLSDFLPNSNISEDCLYLTVYVPGNVSSFSNKSVMVWIHGGAYLLGQASYYDGGYLALAGDVIVVTINYRLGILGFLTSGDSALKGNYGLWDQRLALEWVRDNIDSFGGNPDSVTIFGESAGGFSVSLHTLNPNNTNLFHRAILQSGTTFSQLSLYKSPPNMAAMFANVLRCPNTSTNAILQCLRNQPVEAFSQFSYNDVSSFFRKQFSLPLGYFNDIFLKPTVDGELILDDPDKLLRDTDSAAYKFFTSLDLIVGTVNREGTLVNTDLHGFLQGIGGNLDVGILPCVVCDILAPAIAYDFAQDRINVSSEICSQYKVKETGINVEAFSKQARQTLDMYGDLQFVSGAVETLNIHSAGSGRSYQYLFSRRFETTKMPPWYNGSGHGEELPYLFTNQVSFFKATTGLTSIDNDIKQSMMTYWTSFAKYGDPNFGSLPKWKEFTYKDKEYLNFGANGNITMKNMLWPERMKLWFKLKGVEYLQETETTTKHDTSGADNARPLSFIYLIAIFQTIFFMLPQEL